jgi:hypothetical protein
MDHIAASAPDATRTPDPLTDNERTLAGLAWLATTIPALIAQDCLHGDEITEIGAGPHQVSVQLIEVGAAARIAARLGLTSWADLDDDDYRHQWWTGSIDGLRVRVSYCRRTS